MPTKMTKQDRIALERLKYHAWVMDGEDWDISQALYQLAPSAWHTIMADLDCHETKDKVTLYLDKSVARSFKAMGKGYQARINRILQSWLAMKMSGSFDTFQAIQKHKADMMERREKMRKEGTTVPIPTKPGDTPPTEPPPEVDW